MTTWSKVQVGLLTAGVLVAVWQLRQHVRQGRELASVAAQARATSQEMDRRSAALTALEQRNLELAETERRAGNQTLLALMRERAAATRAVSEATSESHGIGGALAKVLASPDQWETEQEYLRNEMRSGLGLFFNLVGLSPEKREEYIDLQIDMKHREAERVAALLKGTTTVTDAVRARDQDRLEDEQRRREVLGPAGNAFFESIADGMRNTEAKRLLDLVQQNMGGNALNQEQSERLKGLLKSEFCTLALDDTDLFRPPEEWAQIIGERQQNVLNGIAAWLTPTQVETLKALGAYDLAERQKQLLVRRKTLGIK
jgi:hypothetical protein